MPRSLRSLSIPPFDVRQNNKRKNMNRYHYQNPEDPAEIIDAVSLEELSSLKSRGVLHDNSLVAPEGTKNWTALKNVTTSGARVMPAPPADSGGSDTEIKESAHNLETASPKANAKKFYPTFFLGLFLGVFGVHSFYNGKTRNGILQLITFGGLGVWWLIDMILILTGNFKDKDNNQIPNINPKVSWAVFAVAILIGLASGGGEASSEGGSSPSSEGGSSASSSKYNGLVDTWVSDTKFGSHYAFMISFRDDGKYLIQQMDPWGKETVDTGNWAADGKNGNDVNLYENGRMIGACAFPSGDSLRISYPPHGIKTIYRQ